MNAEGNTRKKNGLSDLDIEIFRMEAITRVVEGLLLKEDRGINVLTLQNVYGGFFSKHKEQFKVVDCQFAGVFNYVVFD